MNIHTAIALLHSPRLLLLDEATTGADVETRSRLLDFVRDTAADGSTVLYSTHYLAEVETLDSRVVILDQGRVIADGHVRDLIAAHAQPVVELTFADEVPPDLLPGQAQRWEGPTARVPTRDPGRTLAELLPRIDTGRLTEVEIVAPSLEAVYLALTGRRYNADGTVQQPRPSSEDSHVPAP